ncbi:hypothetical protein CRG98_043904 [Punica granatum]|uniref:Uncharacterized protein n=1 Tax=Punica granatum TaxID=22663 RepID=A0A2I0HWW2_PUNGR|nr:hypothetical protein CRG98_043904 [Punica granatum]
MGVVGQKCEGVGSMCLPGQTRGEKEKEEEKVRLARWAVRTPHTWEHKGKTKITKKEKINKKNRKGGVTFVAVLIKQLWALAVSSHGSSTALAPVSTGQCCPHLAITAVTRFPQLS